MSSFPFQEMIFKLSVNIAKIEADEKLDHLKDPSEVMFNRSRYCNELINIHNQLARMCVVEKVNCDGILSESKKYVDHCEYEFERYGKYGYKKL